LWEIDQKLQRLDVIVRFYTIFKENQLMTESNPVLNQHVLSTQYEIGLKCYRSISEPTPEDERLAGRCLLATQKLSEAHEMLLRSIGRGCNQAIIELATYHRMLGELATAQSTLLEFNFETAHTIDQALAARELGVILYTKGDLVKAAEALENACKLAASTPLGNSIAPEISFHYGRALADQGHSKRALEAFTASLLETNNSKRILKLGARAECLIHLGRLTEAEADLDEAEPLLPLLPMAKPVMRYVRGLHARAGGHHDLALEILGQAIALAREVDEVETELYAHLEAAAILTHLEQFNPARTHLARSRAISIGAKTEALVNWRAGSLLVRQGKPGGNLDGIALLEQALKTFEHLKLERECGWVRLHLAEAHARTKEVCQIEHWLNAATDTRHALGVGAGLFIELRATPKALEVLRSMPETAYPQILLEDLIEARGPVPINLEMRTLGGVGLLADREKVRLNAGMQVTVEMLAFLILHPDQTLEQVLGNVAFPDSLPERSKSYFHLVRNEIKAALPGVSIPYDNAKRTYSVEFGGMTTGVDFLELQQAVKSGDETGLLRALELYSGPFLPYSDSDWVRVERERLEWAIVNTALRVLETHTVNGQFERCMQIAERVLEIVPTDIAINTCLLRATRSAQGELAGHQVLERIQHRFMTEFGEVPAAFEPGVLMVA
jgi:tetratricopeptide (TPR) repeat protein/DNA-binding SARP family transcriptional activator